MGARLHLVRRGAVYYWRRRLPVPWVPVLGRSHLSWTLNTADPRRARRLRNRLDEEFSRLMDALPARREITEDLLHTLIRDLYRAYSAYIAAEKQAMPKDYEITQENVYDFAFLNLKHFVDLWQQSLDFDETSFAEPTLKEVLAKHRLALAPESDEFGMLRDHAAWIAVGAFRDFAARYNQAEPTDSATHEFLGLEGDLPPELAALIGRSWPSLTDVEAPGRDEERTGPSETTSTAANTDQAQATESAAKADSTLAQRGNAGEQDDEETAPRVRADMLLSDAFEALKAIKFEEHEWSDDTARRAGDGIKLLIAIMGDRPISDYTRSDVLKARRTMERIPSNHGKSPNHPAAVQATIEMANKKEAAAIARVKDKISQGKIDPDNAEHAMDEARVRRLRPRTINNHLSNMGHIYRFAQAEGVAIENPVFKKLFKKTVLNKDADRKVRLIDDNDIYTLLTSPVYTGCKGTRRWQQGGEFIKDALFWIPLLQLFQGMRLEECAQLEVDDLRRFKDSWWLDIKNIGLKQTKTQQSNRVVPLHPFLEQLGFVEHVEAMRSHRHRPDSESLGKRRIFPELKRNARGKLGGYFTKTYLNYRKQIGLQGRDKDGHALRGAFDTYLNFEGVRTIDIADLMGHDMPGQTASRSYRFKPAYKQLREAVEKLTYGFEVRRIDNQPQLMPQSDSFGDEADF